MIIIVKKNIIKIYVNTTNNDYVIKNHNYKYTSNDSLWTPMKSISLSIPLPKMLVLKSSSYAVENHHCWIIL